MTEENKPKPADLGLYARPAESERVTTVELVAAILSVAWVALIGLYFLLSPDNSDAAFDRLSFVATLTAVVLPVAVIWLGALTARSSRAMRDEADRLQAAVDALRQAYVAQAQAQGTGIKSSVEAKLDEIARVSRKTQTAIATFTSIRQHMAPAAPEPPPHDGTAPAEVQQALSLGMPAELAPPPLSVADFIRALHFPENTEDREGFAALRRALADRRVAQLVQASQDVLTLLSQEGIYMDDLTPDRARPEVWRRFARGERGRAIASLGGIRDRSSLALAASRMRQDTIFRDAVHHFLRKFDQALSEFEQTATDADIADLSDTRTARAFMLLGRVTGIFD